MTADGRVMQGSLFQTDLAHVAAGFVHRFLNSDWDLTRFPAADTNAAFAISHDRQC